MTIDSAKRSQLRRQLRQRRNSLSPMQQQQASFNLLRQLMQQPLFVRSQHFALYLSVDGEIDLTPVMQRLWKMKKSCYLPVLHPTRSRELWFVQVEPNTPLKPNRFGIKEPDPFKNHRLPANLLDMALIPLVGFDRQGNRLGMGGGFYDATFAFKRQQIYDKPYLIGVAHACQELMELEVAPWDVALYGTATDKEVILTGEWNREGTH